MPGVRVVLPAPGPVTARLIALDGSKFRAVPRAKRIMGRREIATEAAGLDRRTADYLAGLDETDAREPQEVPGRLTRCARRSQMRIVRPTMGPL